MFKKLQAKAEKMVFQQPSNQPAASTDKEAPPTPATGAAPAQAPVPVQATPPPPAPADGAQPQDAATAAPLPPSTEPAATTTTTDAAPAAPAAVPASEQVKSVDTMGNGTTITKYADGHKTTRYPDGRAVHEYVDGSTTTVYADGREYHSTPAVPKEDALDKAFTKGASMLGLHLSRETTEKITDKGRGFFEKTTGKKVNPKFSN